LGHKSLKSSDKKFWDFSWHEIGFYDLSAMIDFVLKKTNSAKTFYVGHSQGTTSLLVLLSTRPEYNQKIMQAHLMTPVIFMENTSGEMIKIVKPLLEPIGVILIF
jgi:lysosomal acid lipase/cholesteryl ester hydrolase